MSSTEFHVVVARTGTQCCCSYGAAVSGEWPEFECEDCERHGRAFGPTGWRCRRHSAANAENSEPPTAQHEGHG